MLDDPRHLPYLMVWKKGDSDQVLEVARVARHIELGTLELDKTGWVEIKRCDGSSSLIRVFDRPMPLHGGRARLLVCPRCQHPRRMLYPWKLNPAKRHAVFTSTWQCRSCAKLRYASEGGALIRHSRNSWGRLREAIEGPSRSARPEPCYPYVFANPRDAESIMPVR